MSAYFIAQIQIEDETVYQKYLESVDQVFEKFKGKYLALEDSPVCLEGLWENARIVLIEFPCKEDFEEWYYSKAYQEILKYRLSGAQCNSILIIGK